MAKFPAFSLKGSDGQVWKSSALKGQPYVIYFYPKDMTPGCTTEACDFRDNMAKLKRAGIRVFGVSTDSLDRHQKFIDKYDLNFVLLSDENRALIEKAGLWVEKNMYGKKIMGVLRSTFLIGADGSIVQEWRKVSVKGHVDEVLAAVTALKKS